MIKRQTDEADLRDECCLASGQVLFEFGSSLGFFSLFHLWIVYKDANLHADFSIAALW